MKLPTASLWVHPKCDEKKLNIWLSNRINQRAFSLKPYCLMCYSCKLPGNVPACKRSGFGSSDKAAFATEGEDRQDGRETCQGPLGAVIHRYNACGDPHTETVVILRNRSQEPRQAYHPSVWTLEKCTLFEEQVCYSSIIFFWYFPCPIFFP